MEYRGFRYEIAKVVGDRTYAMLRAKRVIDILCRPRGAPARREWRAVNVLDS